MVRPATNTGATWRDHPEVRALRGSWERDPSHFPLPLSPAFASLYLPWQDAALTAMFQQFGYLGGRMRSRLADGYLYTHVDAPGGWMPPAWLLRPLLRLWWVHPPTCARVRRAVWASRTDYSERVLDLWERRWRPRIEIELRAALATDLPALDDAALLRHLDTLCARTAAYVRIHFILHGAIAPAMARLEFVCRATPALHGIRAADLVAGLSAESSAPGRALRQLAAMLRARPSLQHRADEIGPTAIASDPHRLGRELGAAFQGWMAAYGHRVTSHYEFVEPTLAEQPERIVARILALAARPDAGDDDERLTARREAATEAARSRLGAEAARRDFDAAVRAAQRAYPVRDANTVLTFNSAFAVMRYALLEAGRRWAGRFLDQRDDVFFLTAAEVRDGLRRGATACSDGLQRHAAARRRTWQRRLRLPPPPLRVGPPLPVPPLDVLPAEAAFMTNAILWYLRGIQALPAAGVDVADHTPAAKHAAGERFPGASRLDVGDGSGDGGHVTATGARAAPGAASALRGLPAVGGRFRGVARVIEHEDDFDRLQPGEVLVCPMTTPAWSVLLLNAGALVTDHGGVLSHPAVIAREYGIPAVVATGDGTRRIPDGAMVRVDGDAGTVTVER